MKSFSQRRRVLVVAGLKKSFVQTVGRRYSNLLVLVVCKVKKRFLELKGHNRRIRLFFFAFFTLAVLSL